MSTTDSHSNQPVDKLSLCPPGIQEIVAEFREVLPRERLEYLLEYSESMPELPPALLDARDAMEQVHECQSPVFLHTDIDGNTVRFHFDVPPESPTVRGYAAILQEGFDQVTKEEVLRAPDDIYLLLGLQEAISPLRLRGLHALMVYMKRQVERQSE